MILKGEIAQSRNGRYHWQILQANKRIARSPSRGYRSARQAEAALRRKVRELMRRSSGLRRSQDLHCEYGRLQRVPSDIRPAEYDDDDDDDDDGVAVDL